MKWYNLKNIDKYPCAYRLIIGKRTNGKTYSVCNKGVNLWAETGKKFAYIRRYRDDITTANLQDLLNPQPIVDISDGKWNKFLYRSRQFFAVNDENKKSPPICDTFALNTWERTKGPDRGEYSLILFDEFMTRDQYLKDEVNIFLNMLSSLIRARSGIPIYMIANTVSQFCPYLPDFNIDIQTLKKGSIKQTRDNVVIEYCNDTGTPNANEYFKGFRKSATGMITSGDWEVRDYAHLPHGENYKNYNFHLRFFVVLYDRKICGEVRSAGANLFLYFYPFTGEIKTPDKEIIYSYQTSANPLHSKSFDIAINGAHQLIKELVKQDRVYYSDNMTGEAIKSFYKGAL